MASGVRILLPVLALLLVAVAPLRCPEPRVVVFPAPRWGGVWERFEVAGAVLGTEGNLFDPAAVDLRGEFRAPDGSVFEIPGFATREFRRELVDGRERLEPRGGLHWRVRFTPTEPGWWRWRWKVSTPEGNGATRWRLLRVRAGSGQRHGFLRVSPEDARYLRFDDGTPFFAVGENLSWYDGRGTFAYEEWLDRLAAEGANYVRLWMPSWAFGLEWLHRENGEIVSSSLGDYTDRLDRAWQLDRVFEMAEARGIQIMLCIQNHGPFSLTHNSEWVDNPYSAANGGPLAQPEEIFTDAEARALFKRRVRYLVARWGYATNLLAWELWNEVDLVWNSGAPEVLAWHQEMASELRALDPYHHLVTTSVSGIGTSTPLWSLPEIELTQAHVYAYPFNIFDTGFWLSLLAEPARVPGKPLLLGEFGADFRGPGETVAIDPSHIAFHDGLWIGVVTGMFGTGMTWWWDNLIDPHDLYAHFGAVARFVDGVAFDREGFVASRPPASAPGRRLQAYAMVGAETVLVWVKNLDHHYASDTFPQGGLAGDPTPVEAATLTLSGLADGGWRARWFDTSDGSELGSGSVVTTGGQLTLALPDFVGDLALRLERE